MTNPRRGPRWGISSILAAFLLAVTLGTAPAAALPRQEAWIQLRTPHFTLFSNASERTARGIGLDLERLRSALSQLNPGLELTSPVPTWIYVFKNTSTFQPYRPVYQGKVQSVEGFFYSHPHGNYVAINADPRDEPTEIVYHEYLHHVLGNNYPMIPLWLNEGLAEFYSTFKVSGSEARIGLPIPEHVFWLQQNAMIPLRELVSVDTDSRDYNEGNRRGVFYAQSWAFVHYLLSTTPERRQQTAVYLRDLFNGVPSDQALQRAFGDVALLERDLRAYVQRRVFNSLRVPVAPDGEIQVEMAPLPWPDTLYRLGEMLLHGNQEQRPVAEEHFRAALAVAPEHGPATAGLGRVAQMAGRLAEARPYFEKAARLAPDDFFLQYLLGLSLLEPPPPDPASLPRARAALEKVVALRPDFAEGWGRLAQAMSFEKPLPPEAVRVFETAWRLMPSREDFAFNLALVYTQTGQREKAQTLSDKLLANRPELAEKVREAMQTGEWKEIEEGLVSQGKLAEAVPRLEELLPRMTNPERRAALQSRLEEIRNVLDYNSFGERYNRAVDFLNAGKDAEAIAILEELAAKTRNPGQAAEAKKLLEKVKAGPKKK
jgi:tetratricopeptide (TPR) repeat protein